MRVVLGALLALMLAFGASAVHARSGKTAASDPRVAGGGGGNFQFRECPEGQWLVGVVAAVGDVVDSITAACAPLDKDGRWPPMDRFNPLSNGRVKHPALDDMGGGGGSSQAFVLCPRDTVVIQLQLTTAYFGTTGPYIKGLRMGCAPLAGGKTRWSGDVWGKGPAAGTLHVRCPAGHYAYRLVGMTGRFVDALGLHCELVGRDPSEPVYGAPAPRPPRSDEPRKVDRTAPPERVGREPAFCAKYAQEAVSTKQANAQNRCGLTGPRYDATFEQHAAWCRDAKMKDIESEARARTQGIAACQQCRKYARESVEQFAQAFARCGRNPVSGPMWARGDEASHFGFCFRDGSYNPDADRHFGARAADLRKC